MSSYLRLRIPGARVFFTVALADRHSDLLVRQVGVLRDAVAQTRATRDFRIDAFVVLPDHLHCVWTLPAGDADYSSRWKDIKTNFTKTVGMVGWRSGSKMTKGEAGIWQRRFWEHHIRDEADYAAHVGYCWINPVKHGLVERAVDWPWSSIHRDVRAGLVEPEWSGTVPDGEYGE